MGRNPSGNSQGTESNTEYNADQIKQMSVLEAMRKFPGMYLGGIGNDAWAQIFREVIDNATDEAALQRGKGTVTVHLTGSTLSIEDEGRGIPIGVISGNKISLISIFTEYHTGGKFDNNAYETSAGMHGTGVKAATAFAEDLQVEVSPSNHRPYTYRWSAKHGGKEIEPLQVFKGRGEKMADIHTPAELEAFQKANPHDPNAKNPTGTRVTVQPSAGLLGVDTVVLDSDYIRERCSLVSAATGVHFKFKENDGEEEPISFKDERDYMSQRFGVEKDDILVADLPVHKEEKQSFSGKVYMTRLPDGDGQLLSVVNHIPVTEGRHLIALQKYMCDGVSGQMTKAQRTNVTPSMVLGQGVTALLVIEGQGGAFKSQAKENLISPETSFFVNLLDEGLGRKAAYKAFISELHDSVVATLEQKALKKVIKQAFPHLATIRSGPKLTGCTDLYIVEGDSAGGTVRAARDAVRQGVFSLTGKPPNAYEKKAVTLIGKDGNPLLTELNSIIQTGVYDRYIILSDADPDGKHIAVLLSIFFVKFHPNIVEEGRLLWLVPPLYGVVLKNNEIQYAISDDDLTAITKPLPQGSYHVQRYKGLGEMNAPQMRLLMSPLFPDYAYILNKDTGISDTYDGLFSQRKDIAANRKERMLTLINEFVVKVDKGI